MIRAACTIVSLNYLPYARTLCESYIRLHPDHAFYVLLVDRLPVGMDISQEQFEMVLVEDLGIPDFDSVAFKYDLLKLNTNVKPTFLKSLLARCVDELIYFDPHILICSPFDAVFEALGAHSIVLTPHALSPNVDAPSGEAMLLFSGIFNLGFVAVSRSPEAVRFLTWWEDRCLTLGYAERMSGLFVDQKWINFVPCFFESFCVLKHAGCNVAYWNLHERYLEKRDDCWIVNGQVPLVFYHFSGVRVDGGATISKFYDQFTLDSRPDLRDIFALYRDRLIHHGIREVGSFVYAFGRFSDGTLVNKLQRAIYAGCIDSFRNTSPFDAQGSFCQWAKKHRLQSGIESSAQYNRHTIDRLDIRVRFVNGMLRLALRILGADRYTLLLKYFGFISVLRNQKDLFRDLPAG